MSPREKKVNRASTVCRVILQLFRFILLFTKNVRRRAEPELKTKGQSFLATVTRCTLILRHCMDFYIGDLSRCVKP